MELRVTGSAMLTSLGADKELTFEGLSAGRSGGRPLQSFARRRHGTRHAGTLAEPSCGLDRPLQASELLARAVRGAVAEAGLPAPGVRWGVIVGIAMQEPDSLEHCRAQDMPASIDELHFEGALNQALGSAVPVITLRSSCSASSLALAFAEDAIADGAFDCVVVAGCQAGTDAPVGSQCDAHALHGLGAHPFDRDSRGTRSADGAAAIVVERPEHARRRAAPGQATVRSVGTSGHAHDEGTSDVGSIVRAIRDAYRRGGVRPADVDLVMAHGSGDPSHDRAEAVAIRESMGPDAQRARISALKSMTGHTSGASGLIGVVAAIEALDSGVVPPTVGLRHAIDEAAMLNIVTEASHTVLGGDVAQINTLGAGGIDAVVIVERA